MFGEWKKEYELGISEIDDQHRELLRMISQLDSGLEQGEIFELLDGLTDYAGYHFSTEEGLMVEAKYSGYEAHLLEHHGFVERVREFVKDAESDPEAVLPKLSAFLFNWLINHIQHVDRAYVPAMKANANA